MVQKYVMIVRIRGNLKWEKTESEKKKIQKEIHMKENKIQRIRLICAAIVGFVLILLVFQKNVFYKNDEITVKDKGHELISMLGDTTFRQDFIGSEGELQKLRLRFSNETKEEATGEVYISVYNDKDELLAQAGRWAQQIQHYTYTTITFDTPVKTEAGKQYYFVIETKNFVNPKGAAVYVTKRLGGTFKKAIVNDTETDGRVESKFVYNLYQGAAKRNMMILLLLTIVILVLPYEKWNALKKIKHLPHIAEGVVAVFVPGVCVAMQQLFCGYTIRETLDFFISFAAVVNYCIYFMVLTAAFLIAGRIKFAAIVTLVLTYILGLANYLVWQVRGTPIIFTDLQSAQTAMKVAGNYEFTFDTAALWATICLLCTLVLCIGMPKKIRLGIKGRGIVLAVFAVQAFIFQYVFFETKIMHDNGIEVADWNVAKKYDKNGPLLSFIMTWTYTQVEKPEGYSAKAVEEIIAPYKESAQVAENEELPNIICIMNETLSDLTSVGELELSEDCLPFYRSLSENTIKGDVYVSVIGGNTANSEFEFLTGNSMAFLPFHCIPYNSYIERKTANLTYQLETLGYQGRLAIHPYDSDGWSRDTVYPLMGFTQFIDKTAFVQPKYVRNLISDESSYDYIISAYEQAKQTSDAPFYAFNVTIQNHGGYVGTKGMIEEKIKITNKNLEDAEATQYINLVKESDVALQALIEYYQSVDDKTVIVFFGDHQPVFKSDFYDKLMGKETEKLSLTETKEMYKTPYLIWANYDIEEGSKDISLNYLSAYLMQAAGLELTPYQKFQLELSEEVPVITGNFYIGNDGKVYGLDEESAYTERLRQYAILQYGNMFDTAIDESVYYLAP